MNSLDTLKGSPKALFIHYSLHTVIGMLAMSSAIMIDGFFVGRWIGSEALAAISLVWPIIGMTFGFYFMVIIGGCASIGNLMGAGKQEKANKLFTQITLLVTGISLVAMTVGLFASSPIVSLLKVPEELRELGQVYFSILMGTMIFFGANNLASYSSRLVGHPKVYGAVMTSSAVANIILDALFIILFGWGIRGAAFATGFSQLVGVCIGVLYMRKRDSALTFGKPDLPLKTLLKAIVNGISEFFTEISYSVQALMINFILVDIYGTSGITAYVILGYFVIFAGMAIFGFAEASQPLISQNNGAKQRERVEKFLRLTIIASLGVGTFVALVTLLFYAPSTRIFIRMEDAHFQEVLTLVRQFALLLFPSYILMGLGICLSSYFTALEHGIISGIISTLRLLIFPALGLVTSRVPVDV